MDARASYRDSLAKGLGDALWGCSSERPATPDVGWRRSRAGASQGQQIVRHYAEPDPSLHARQPTIQTSSKAMTALQSADSPFRAGAPSQRGANATPASLPTLPGKHDFPDALVARKLLVATQRKARVRHGQLRRPAEELAMPVERRCPQDAIGDAARADRIVGNELGLGLLDLDELAELGRLGGFALSDGLGVRLEEAQQFVRVMRVASDDAGARLGQDAPDGRGRLAQVVPQPLAAACRLLARPAVRPLSVADRRAGDAQQFAIELRHPRLRPG